MKGWVCEALNREYLLTHRLSLVTYPPAMAWPPSSSSRDDLLMILKSVIATWLFTRTNQHDIF